MAALEYEQRAGVHQVAGVHQGVRSGQSGLLQHREHRALGPAPALVGGDDPQRGERSGQPLFADAEALRTSSEQHVEVRGDRGEGVHVGQRVGDDDQVGGDVDVLAAHQPVDEVLVEHIAAVAQQLLVHGRAERLDQIAIEAEDGLVLMEGTAVRRPYDG
ncbi:hypothetical protein ABZ934_30730 [Streptomyces sp. NPDC046557]|uniref:hypothetical protein n=1 Tax=Streptomyces sp. NPDC046557 TaxID=3155372 RepID=UPI00340FBAA2